MSYLCLVISLPLMMNAYYDVFFIPLSNFHAPLYSAPIHSYSNVVMCVEYRNIFLNILASSVTILST